MRRLQETVVLSMSVAVLAFFIVTTFVFAQQFTITEMSYSNGQVTLTWDMPTNRFIVDRTLSPTDWTNTAFCTASSSGTVANSVTFSVPDIDGHFFRVQAGLQAVPNVWDPNLWPTIQAEMGPKLSPTNYLYDIEFAGITTIDAPNDNITNISGAEFLIDLENLDLHGNAFSDLTPLSGLSKLKVLEINDGLASNLAPLAPLIGLDELWADSSFVTDLSPLSQMKSLRRLGLYLNNFTSIAPLSGLTNLVYLDLSYNSITDITPLIINAFVGGLGAGDSVDLWSCPNLSPAATSDVNTLRVTYGVNVGAEF